MSHRGLDRRRCSINAIGVADWNATDKLLATGHRESLVLAARRGSRIAGRSQGKAGSTGVPVARRAVMLESMGRSGGIDAAQTEHAAEQPADHQAPRADRAKRLGELVKAMSIHSGVLSKGESGVVSRQS